jgi:hypothetical protein
MHIDRFSLGSPDRLLPRSRSEDRGREDSEDRRPRWASRSRIRSRWARISAWAAHGVVARVSPASHRIISANSLTVLLFSRLLLTSSSVARTVRRRCPRDHPPESASHRYRSRCRCGNGRHPSAVCQSALRDRPPQSGYDSSRLAGPPPIGHGLASAPAAPWPVQQQPQVAPRDHGEAWTWVQVYSESELLGVERDSRIDVVHDVADADRSHSHPFRCDYCSRRHAAMEKRVQLAYIAM